MSTKQGLQKLISDLETKKFRDGESKGLISSIQEEQTKALAPVFQKLAQEVTASMAANFEHAIKGLQIHVPEPKATPVDVRMPEMKMPDFPAWPDMPEIKMPAIKIPDVNVHLPDSMRVDGQVSLKGISRKSPLPVTLMGEDGKPLSMSIPMMGGGGGTVPGTSVNIASSSTVGNGTKTVVTAGVRVQLPNQGCRRLFIQAHESNTGTIVIGGSDVVAALVGRSGLALFATQSQLLNITNLNMIWIDSTASSDQVNYYYET